MRRALRLIPLVRRMQLFGSLPPLSVCDNSSCPRYRRTAGGSRRLATNDYSCRAEPNGFRHAASGLNPFVGCRAVERLATWADIQGDLHKTALVSRLT